MISTSFTRKSLSLGISSAALLAAMATPAFAQVAAPATAPATTDTRTTGGAQDTSQDTQDVVVTGTISRNPAAATASPVTTLTTEDLSRRGLTTIADALQQLTANNAGTDPGSWSSHGFATGASTVSLRGLNDAYTLILFDGLRTAPYPLADDGTRTIVDVNSIGQSAVDRIDVLQDGASAVYGSDAIAGVVNVISKKTVEGLHMEGAAGISQQGDAGERRVNATYGYGNLDRDRFNVWINGEYQQDDALYARDRGFPFNTANQSSICGVSNGQGSAAAGSTTCATNGVVNGLQAPGGGVGGTGYNGFGTTTVPYVRPYSVNPATGAPVASLGGYSLLNPGAGCANLPSYTLTAAQRAIGLTSAGQPVYPATVCQQDLANQYNQYDPKSQRLGGTVRGTVKLTDTITAYAMFNYQRVKEDSRTTPGAFTGTAATAPDGRQVTINGVYLPVYVCAAGVGAINAAGNAYATGCTAANGTLNPNNPYAAQGSLARLVLRDYQARETLTNSQTYRLSGGVNGSAGIFDFGIDATTSKVTLDRDQKGYFYIQGLLNAIAQGTYNFVNPTANTDAQRQTIFPDNYNHAVSKLTQVLGHVGADLFELPGGKLNVTVQGEYRFEAIHAPSPNPSNANPYLRYYTLNAAGVDGARNQYSVAYDVTAPVFEFLKLKAEGGYDHYSTGQSRFSPKFEAELTPIKQIKLRGTYGKGFRIPNFVEAFGLPTTGYVSSAINCAKYTAFCAAHASNPAYYAGTYSYGLTSIANPSLAPEKSTNWTAGVVLEPVRMLTLTADYWSVKIRDLIIPATANQALLDTYYQNNGAVTQAGFTITPSSNDPQNPNALPLIGTISASFQNAAQLRAEGVDISATLRLPLTNSGLRLISQAQATYLSRLSQTQPDGSYLRYDGTLGPCNITSCSGAPKWRAIWSNTLDLNGRASMTLTGYYTAGYSEVATDEGGVYGNCNASVGAQVIPYADQTTPILCNAKASFDLDLTGSVKVGTHFTIYGNILNIINQKPTYDPGAAYNIYQFNPAWQDKQFIGRYFRVGVKVDF